MNVSTHIANVVRTNTDRDEMVGAAHRVKQEVVELYERTCYGNFGRGARIHAAHVFALYTHNGFKGAFKVRAKVTPKTTAEGIAMQLGGPHSSHVRELTHLMAMTVAAGEREDWMDALDLYVRRAGPRLISQETLKQYGDGSWLMNDGLTEDEWMQAERYVH